MAGRALFGGGERVVRHPRHLSGETATHPPLVSPDPAALRINLSYVLHEPSHSRAVADHVTLILACARHALGATRALAKVSDDVLATRIVARDDRALDQFQRERPQHVVSLDLGASPLLARVLRLVLPSGSATPLLHWLDRPSPDRPPMRLSLFRHPAELSWPQHAEPVVWFAILVFRPGWNSLLLDIVRVEREAPVSHVSTVLERTVREFVDQWWTWRPWWDRPAEQVYPELREETP